MSGQFHSILGYLKGITLLYFLTETVILSKTEKLESDKFIDTGL